MLDVNRRQILLGFLASASAASVSKAISQTLAPAPDDPRSQFIARANKQWMDAFRRSVAQEKEEEKHGEFASLAPPEQLVPFKNWHYYYLKGTPEVWRPNAGQSYRSVVVPVGFVTDLASIPQAFWSAGLRPEGPYAYAAIVHDYLYWTQRRTRKEADEILRIAMNDSKVDKVVGDGIYLAVRAGGQPAWDRNAKLKAHGEKRILRKFPKNFTITWAEWKKRPDVFAD